jgi:hypothetical protein
MQSALLWAGAGTLEIRGNEGRGEDVNANANLSAAAGVFQTPSTPAAR